MSAWRGATIVDTTALAAVIFGEPDAEALLGAMLSRAGGLLVSAATLVEAGIVVQARQGADAAQDLRVLIGRLGIEVVAVDEDQAEVAIAAWRRFGKGRHPAALNYGDCFAYALTTVTGGALLFKGHDFGQTDLVSAL